MATATYPPPPPFYRLYKDYLENPNSAPAPPPPIEGTYVCYGGGNYTTDDVLPSLEEQGVRQLYPKGPNVDFKKELRSLNRELQLHILELADVLVERPSQYARRVEDISLIFKNLHHLLNSLRPHQARATLIHILELQIQRRKQAVEDIKRYDILILTEIVSLKMELSDPELRCGAWLKKYSVPIASYNLSRVFLVKAERRSAETSQGIPGNLRWTVV
ncbi:hypothetical protein Patl1_32883 [Pistacia atlantica]|uniref:Uncharacterized protein n=1 Tax=Pistacia atlantica TaxID=434234 RepID=A0ACC1AQQ7_9ROSI|nr:hypothetical protein Patl1_32883 [Pistacia atlantica]